MNMVTRTLILTIAAIIMPLKPILAKYGDATVARVISVYDGDTFRVDIAEWPAIIGQNIAIRVGGVDTPEIRGKCAYEKELAQKAKAFVQDILNKGNRIELRNIERGKYFRIVADVFVDGNSLEKALLQRSLATQSCLSLQWWQKTILVLIFHFLSVEVYTLSPASLQTSEA